MSVNNFLKVINAWTKWHCRNLYLRAAECRSRNRKQQINNSATVPHIHQYSLCQNIVFEESEDLISAINSPYLQIKNVAQLNEELIH